MKTFLALFLYIFIGCSQVLAATFGTTSPTVKTLVSPTVKTLVFDTFARGDNRPELDVGPAHLREISGGSIYIYRTGDFGMAKNGGFCAYLSDGTCMGDFVLDFVTPIFDLSFTGFYAKPTDSAIVSLFDGNELIFSGQYFGNSSGMISFDFTQIPRLTRIMIEDASVSLTKGLAYGSIVYRDFVVVPAIVPLPMPFVLLTVAIGLLGLLKIGRVRRQQLRIGS